MLRGISSWLHLIIHRVVYYAVRKRANCYCVVYMCRTKRKNDRLFAIFVPYYSDFDHSRFISLLRFDHLSDIRKVIRSFSFCYHFALSFIVKNFIQIYIYIYDLTFTYSLPVHFSPTFCFHWPRTSKWKHRNVQEKNALASSSNLIGLYILFKNSILNKIFINHNI